MELYLLLFVKLFKLLILCNSLIDWQLGCLIFYKQKITLIVSELSSLINFYLLKLIFNFLFFGRPIFQFKVLFLNDTLCEHLFEFLFMFNLSFVKLFKLSQLRSNWIVWLCLWYEGFLYCKSLWGGWLLFSQNLFDIWNRWAKDLFEIFIVGWYKVNVFWHFSNTKIIKWSKRSLIIRFEN